MDLPDSVWHNLNASFVQTDIRDLFELNKVNRNPFPYAIIVPYLTTKIIYVNTLCCKGSKHVRSLRWNGFFVCIFLLTVLLYCLSLFGWFPVMNIYVYKISNSSRMRF